MARAKITTETGTSGTIATTTRHTGLGQRETLEAIMLNLADHLGIRSIAKRTSARGAEFYRPEGMPAFQSATNTIYELSEILSGTSNEGGAR